MSEKLICTLIIYPTVARKKYSLPELFASNFFSLSESRYPFGYPPYVTEKFSLTEMLKRCGFAGSKVLWGIDDSDWLIVVFSGYCRIITACYVNTAK